MGITKGLEAAAEVGVKEIDRVNTDIFMFLFLLFYFSFFFVSFFSPNTLSSSHPRLVGRDPC